MLNNLSLSINKASGKARQQIEEANSLIKPLVGADRYSSALFESKVIADTKYLNTLGLNILEESDREKFLGTLQLIYEGVEELLQEVDTRPRMCSVSLNNELNENTSLNIYSNYLTENINKTFSKPLFEGTLLNDHKDESKLLMESLVLIQESENVDAELFLKYALFEESLTNGLVDIILSNETKNKVLKYISIQESTYFDLFDRNAKVIMNELYENTTMLSSMLSPKLFEESLKAPSGTIVDEPLNVKEFAGISSAFKATRIL